MTDDRKELNKIIAEIEKKDLSKLPLPVREFLKKRLEKITTVPIPIATFKENEWVIATTPLIDVCAQGKTEDEAVCNLVAMIDDYMTDPHTKKPKIEAMINMQVSIKSVPIDLPIGNALTNSGAVSDTR